MPRRTHDSTGAGLDAARRQFERWRKGCRGYGRIPNELWKVAAETAVVHGVEATASQLQLDADRLKQRMRSLGHEEPAAARPQFVELPAFPSASPAECTLELEEPSGRTLRISLKGQATTQALELGEMLWRGQS